MQRPQSVRYLALAAFALLAACTPSPVTTHVLAPPATAEAAACAAQHGALQPACRSQNLMCVIAYADAGKPCRDKTDCQGRCLAEPGAAATAGTPATGRCQANSSPCGCQTWIENGQIAATLCVD